MYRARMTFIVAFVSMATIVIRGESVSGQEIPQKLHGLWKTTAMKYENNGEMQDLDCEGRAFILLEDGMIDVFELGAIKIELDHGPSVELRAIKSLKGSHYLLLNYPHMVDIRYVKLTIKELSPSSLQLSYSVQNRKGSPGKTIYKLERFADGEGKNFLDEAKKQGISETEAGVWRRPKRKP